VLEREIEVQRTRAADAVVPLLARAVLVARRGRSEEAVALHERVAALCQAAGEPVDAACAHLAAAALWERVGRADAAAASLDRASACWPMARVAAWDDDERPPLERARKAWSVGRLEQSVLLYRGLAAEARGEPADPASSAIRAEAHLRLAQWERLHGRLPAADRHLTRALRDEPEGGAPVATLVEVLGAFGWLDELVTALERRRTTVAGEARAATVGALGEVLERAGRADQAVVLYKEALEQAPEDTALLARLAEIFRRESQAEALVPVLERLFDLACVARAAEPGAPVGPLDAEVVGLELATLLAESAREPARASAVLQRLVDLRPQSREARAALAALDDAAGAGNDCVGAQAASPPEPHRGGHGTL
jgi:tetratricopeptide (TPR) repeat protein